MADEEVVVNLTYDARASANRLSADLDKSIQSLQKVVDKTNEVSKSVERINGSYSGLGRLVNNLANSLDPWNAGLRNAISQVDTLTSKITALNSKQSRNVDEDALLTRSLAIRGQLIQKTEEYRAASLAAAAAQDKLNNQAYIEGFSRFVTITKAASVSVEAHTQAVNLFKLKIDSTIGSLSSFANAQQMLSNSTNKMTSDWAAASGLMNRLTQEFNPGIVAADGLTAAMIRLNQARKLGIVDGDEFVIQQKRIADSFDPIMIKAKQAAEVERQAAQERFKFQEQMAPSSSIAQHNKDLKDTADRLDFLTAKYNQDATAANNYRKTISEINEVYNANRIGLKEVGIETNKAIDVYNRSTVAGEKVIDNIKKQTNAHFLNRIGALEAQAAIINSVQAISSGMNITHVAIMEGAQVMGAFVQGSSQGFGIFKTAILAMISPIGLVVTGLGLLAAGFAVVLTRAISNENQLRRFDTQLGGITQSSLTSSVGLQKLSYDLRAIGVAATDAEKGIISLGQNLNVNSQGNSGAIRTLSDLSVNVGARLGIGDAAGFAKVNEAINGQIAGIIKLGLETRSLTTDEVKIAQTEALHGNQLKAINDLLKIMDDRLSGVHKKSIDDAVQGIHSLVGEWNTLLNKLADLIPWKKIEEELATFVKGLSNLTDIVSHLAKGDLKINIGFSIGGYSIDDILNKIKGLLPEQSDMAKRAQANFASQPGQQVGTFPSANGSVLSASVSNPILRGGALTSLSAANVNNKDIQDLNQDFAQRVNDFLNAEASNIIVNSAARFGNHPSRFNSGGTGLHNADILGQGLAVDLGNLSPAAASRLSNFGLHQTVPGDWGHIEPIEIPTASQATGAARMAAGRAFIQSNSGIRSNIANSNIPGIDNGVGVANTGLIDKSTEAIAAQDKAVTVLNRDASDAIKNARLFNIEQAAQTAFSSKYNQVLDQTGDKTDAWNQANIELNKTRQVGLIDLQKNIESQQIQIKGDNQVTDAMKGGVEAMIQADARTKAILENRQTGISVEEAYKKALAEGAATAVKGAAEATVAMTPEIAAQERLGVALNQSAAAGHAAEVQNQAIAATEKARVAAVAAGIPIDEGRLKTLLETNLAQTKKLDLDKQINAFKQQDIQSGNEIQSLQLQVGLQGKTSQEIDRQVSLLTTKQALEAAGLTSNDEEYNKRLQIVDAVGRMKIALDDAQRAQQRLEDGLKQMAETIGTALTTAIAGLFDKSKVTDWGAQIKSTLTSIGSSLVQSTLIKPLTGSIFSALGFGKLAQEFGASSSGSGGGLGGILSSLFGGSSGSSGSSNSTTVTLTPNSSGGFSLSSAAGAGKNIFDLFSASSGTTSATRTGLDALLFGSGAVNSGFAAGTGSGAGIFTNLTTGVTSDILPSVATEATSGISGGLLGGLGIGGGATSALSSILPFAGPILGIGSMFLGSLFGNKKPSNNVSTGGISLTGGGTTVANPFSSGNAQNDQTAKQITDAISMFTKNIIKQTGGSISGNVDVQAGTRDGIKIGGTIGSVATGLVGEVKFADAASAIAATSLAIAQHMEGVSDTFKKVLAQVSDATQIDAAITFVTTYDKLKTALDSASSGAETADAAFSSIATDAKKTGPFATAMGQIQDQFKALTDSANQFGLSLDPVIFGLDQATKRLQGDFRKALDTTFNSIQGNDYLSQIETAKQDLLNNQNEASAVLLNTDLAVQDKINAIYNKTISNLIDNLQKDLKDLVTNITSGTLSGVKIPQAIAAAQSQYDKELAMVQGGNLGESANLAAAGTNLLTLSQTGYGNGPPTATRRSAVLGQISDVLQNSSNSISNLITIQPQVETAAVVAPVVASNAAVASASTTSTDVAATNTDVTPASVVEFLQNIDTAGGAARGSLSTPRGRILVGELGSEWFLPKGNDPLNLGNWIQVGQHGREVINQEGGGMVIPFPYQPKDIQDKYLENRSFANGTISAPNWMSSNSNSNDGLKNVIKQLREEIGKLNNTSQNGIMVNREGFSESVNHLRAIKTNTDSSKTLTPVNRRAV